MRGHCGGAGAAVGAGVAAAALAGFVMFVGDGIVLLCGWECAVWVCLFECV